MSCRPMCHIAKKLIVTGSHRRLRSGALPDVALSTASHQARITHVVGCKTESYPTVANQSRPNSLQVGSAHPTQTHLRSRPIA